MTQSVYECVKTYSDENPKSDVFSWARERWAHVLIRDIDFQYGVASRRPWEVNEALVKARKILVEQFYIENEDMVTVISKPYDGYFGFFFTDENVALQVRLTLESDGKFEIEFHGR